MDTLTPTERTRVVRLPSRGAYDRATIDAILDEALVCHVGVVAGPHPVVIPTTFVRVGDRVCFHGASSSRTLRALRDGAEVCLTVTLVDGLVLARSAFHHSVNYRAVMVFGRAEELTDRDAKLAALAALVEKVARGRSTVTRPPNDVELRATGVYALAIAEASAKVRTGPPVDDEADFALPCWAGVIPMRTEFGAPVPDARIAPGSAPPDEVLGRARVTMAE
jgi:nitroimidazol reductase NimA-like FMN-containing flavoprotein (pyridoxamine 5'-phosphate oxidase superfamily)